MKKFHQMTIDERQEFLIEQGSLTQEEVNALSGRDGLTEETANQMIENGIGIYSLPIGIAQHFLINGKHVLIPMVIEEPSVIAAASNGAKIVEMCGGFIADADEPKMIGQIQIVGVDDLHAAASKIMSHKAEILQEIARDNMNMEKHGGGPRDLIVRTFPSTDTGSMLIVHVILNVGDAMGANAVNTAMEKITPMLESITGGTVRLRILSNLADRRLARASCAISPEFLAMPNFSGEEVRNRILEAASFAEADPYRAVTHNKGIMNGIDAVTLATGNDWRSIESGAHSWACKDGRIRPLSHWRKNDRGELCGTIELPLALGIVGGATRVHPGAKAAIRLMRVESARELAEITASVGLAQNLSALRALSTEGIQRGHMTLHAKQIALSVGAKGDAVDAIASKMAVEKNINSKRAIELLNEMKNNR